MSFVPASAITAGVNEALIGATVPRPNFLSDEIRPRSGEDPTDVDQDSAHHSLVSIVIVIFITVIIFVAIISIYDVFRSHIINFHARQALLDPKSKNTKDDIEKTLIANQSIHEANISFSILAIIFAIILLPILFIMYNKIHITK